MVLCKHFGSCGGCYFYDTSYGEQIKIKVEKVSELFSKHISSITKVSPSPKEIYYRNRMDYVVSEKDNKIIVGLKEKGKWWKVVDLEECFLLSKEGNLIKNLFRDFANKHNIKAWDLRKHKGVLRYLIIREGKFTGERMVVINTSNDYLSKGFNDSKKYSESEEEKKEKEKLHGLFLEFYDHLQSEGIKVTSFLHGVNKTITDISFSSEINVLGGKDHILEHLFGYKFKIGPNSFFQTNSFTAELMVKKVHDLVKESNNALLLDLYAGSGTFSLPFSKYFEKIYAIEISKESINLYKENLRLNNISEDKFHFFTSSVEKGLRNKEVREFLEKKPLIVVDPPRSGLTPSVVNYLKNSPVEQIIYVSCNPQTQERDISMLGFKVKELYVFDQFPQTPHVETIALLERVS